MPAAAKPASPASAAQPEPPRPRHPLATPAPFAPVDAGAARALHDELASIKKLVTEVLSVSRAVPISSASLAGLVPEPLAALAERLSLTGVDSTIVQRIVQGSRSISLRAPSDARPAILAALASQIPCRAPEVPERGPASPNRPHVIALVGPTGVGKTTTIAKLAAHFKLRQGLRVGLLTTDTYRIAAVDQLRTYANILGLPLRVVLTPPEVSPALAALRDCDVVLMDNAGRSQNDGSRLNDLSRFLAAARADQTHLVLSATATEPVLRKAVELFRVASPDRLILTKLDEAVHLGVLANLPNHAGLPLALVTTGQEVPDQFRFATPDQIAALVLDGWNSQDEASDGGKNDPPDPADAESREAEAPVVVVPRRGAAEVRA
jgi:flagellar biosynthesis protein FlhF